MTNCLGSHFDFFEVMGSDMKFYLKAFLLKTLVVGVFVMAIQMKLGPDPTDKVLGYFCQCSCFTDEKLGLRECLFLPARMSPNGGFWI